MANTNGAKEGWNSPQNMSSQTFTCGYCGSAVASSQGYHIQASTSKGVYICPHCKKPTYLNDGTQIPGVAPGSEISHLPQDIEALYREARNCIAASCYTSAVLTCRKLLMNIAVSQGAGVGGTFLSYVEHLANQGYVPPNGKGWVDHIRKKGNEATHEIILMNKSDAEELLLFLEMLLKFIYEFPNRIPKP